MLKYRLSTLLFATAVAAVLLWVNVTYHVESTTETRLNKPPWASRQTNWQVVVRRDILSRGWPWQFQTISRQHAPGIEYVLAMRTAGVMGAGHRTEDQRLKRITPFLNSSFTAPQPQQSFSIAKARNNALVCLAITVSVAVVLEQRRLAVPKLHRG